ncbi:MAG: hypothetical protein ACKVHS_08925, partial [Flavobacteriales bacterium]
TTGSAGTAATLTTARSIGGVDFDGSEAIVPTTFTTATFSGDVTVDSTTFHVDSTNNRVGIGTTAPDGPLHLKLATNSNFTGFTYQTGDVKTVMSNTGDGGTNISILQVYKSVQNRVPSAIDYHSETATASNVYTYCVNPYGGRIGLGTDNPNSDLTMGARIYNTTGFEGITGTPSKGDPSNTTTTLPYTQYSTSNPVTAAGYYFVNPYPGEAQCTIVYDNAQTTLGGLAYFYQNGPGYQPATTFPNSTVGISEFTIPMLETGTIRINAIHMKPVNGCQIRITAVYWVPFRGVTANIREGGKLVLGTVGGLGTPQGSLSFRPEYEQPTGNQLEPKEKVENGLAWMTDLSTWHNSGLGGNGINWSKGNATYGVSTGARIWFQPGSFTSVSSGAAGNHGRLNLSAGYSTGTSNTPDITITSNKRVGIGTSSPATNLNIQGDSGGVPPTTGGEGTSNGIFRVRDNYNVALDIGTKGSSPWTTWLQVADAASMGLYYPLSLQPNGGNVGIGTTNPTTALEISRNFTTNGDKSAMISFTNTATGYHEWQIGPTIYSGNAGFGIKGGADGFGNISDIIAINNTDVGIGTANPIGNLHIKQNDNDYYSQNAGLRLEANGTTSMWAIVASSYSTVSGTLAFGSSSDGGTTWADRAYISHVGNENKLDFTGQHRAFIEGVSYSDYETLEGLIVSANKNKYYNIDEDITTGANAIQISQSLPLVSMSTTEKDKSCFGVISGSEDPETREYAQGSFVSVMKKQVGDIRAFINSVGEGAIWVTDIN